MATAAQSQSADQTADQTSVYANIIHRFVVEDGFAESLVNLTEAGREYLESLPLQEPARSEFFRFLRVAAIGNAAERAAQSAPEPPELRELREAYAKIQQKQAMEQMEDQANQAKEATKDIWETTSSMRKGLRLTVKQIDDAFLYTMWMYIASFVMGIALIAAGIVSAFIHHGKDTETLSIALGGLGTATTLAFFFTKPPERLQSSRANLAQLQCALLVWFNDFLYQNGLLQILWPETQDPAKRPLVIPKIQHISRDILAHTNQILEMLQKYCKLIENPADRSDAGALLESIKRLVSASGRDAK
jgi:hypothetical protein